MLYSGRFSIMTFFIPLSISDNASYGYIIEYNTIEIGTGCSPSTPSWLNRKKEAKNVWGGRWKKLVFSFSRILQKLLCNFFTWIILLHGGLYNEKYFSTIINAVTIGHFFHKIKGTKLKTSYCSSFLFEVFLEILMLIFGHY